MKTILKFKKPYNLIIDKFIIFLYFCSQKCAHSKDYLGFHEVIQIDEDGTIAKDDAIEKIMLFTETHKDQNIKLITVVILAHGQGDPGDYGR